MLSYKGFKGFFEFDEKTSLFPGKVSNTNYPVTFQGKSVESTEQDFRDAINEYLACYKRYDKVPDKSL